MTTKLQTRGDSKTETALNMSQKIKEERPPEIIDDETTQNHKPNAYSDKFDEDDDIEEDYSEDFNQQSDS